MGDYINRPKSELTAVFDRRAEVLKNSRGPLDYHEKVTREEQSIPFCKFVSYLDETGSSIGCIIHPGNTDSERDLRQDERVKRSVCPTFSCKVNDIFKNGDEVTRDAMLDFIDGMDWYSLSHLIRQERL